MNNYRTSLAGFVATLTSVLFSGRRFKAGAFLCQFGGAVICWLECASLVIAQDWTQWRGPARDGLVPASSAPTVWPASWKRAWRVELGEGFPSPVISGQRVFIHSRRDPEEIVTAVDRASGKVLWQQPYPAAFQKNEYAVKMAKGPNATPLIIGQRVFTLGATGVLNAWDAATGRR